MNIKPVTLMICVTLIQKNLTNSTVKILISINRKLIISHLKNLTEIPIFKKKRYTESSNLSKGLCKDSI